MKTTAARDDANIGSVRSQIEALTRWRIATPFTADQQARYDELCACEQMLLDSASPADVRVMGRDLLTWRSE
jgi:hypothetical protein